ncbi:serine/arginine repetitive matrix protein 1-like [Panicum hallii]|uniref:serine/arginine repetitive matrix protein 1-like n=1 Tax=Panicum hallii TaxID=206008 RepID=UPI000DF4D679|nr:serine/arginine repetitive matrix protein 1-like [Panicum hallii]
MATRVLLPYWRRRVLVWTYITKHEIYLSSVVYCGHVYIDTYWRGAGCGRRARLRWPRPRQEPRVRRRSPRGRRLRGAGCGRRARSRQPPPQRCRRRGAGCRCRRWPLPAAKRKLPSSAALSARRAFFPVTRNVTTVSRTLPPKKRIRAD